MRTKTLLLSAAMSVCVAAPSMAQVFSENSVGYYVLDLQQGFNVIANQFNNGDNNLNTLMANDIDALADAGLLKWDAAGQTFTPKDTYFVGAGWLDQSFGNTATTLAPGEGAFLSVTAPTSITFVGEVPQGDLSVSIPVNFSLISQPTPQALALDAGDDAIPAGQDDAILFWDAAGQTYEAKITYFDGAGWLDQGFNPADVSVGVGEGFFYNRAAGNGATSWDRTFSVN